MEEKGIVDHDFLPSEPRRLGSGQRLDTTASCSGQGRGGGASEAGLKRETISGNNPFLLHVLVHVLQGVKDVLLPPIPSQKWLGTMANPHYEPHC